MSHIMIIQSYCIILHFCLLKYCYLLSYFCDFVNLIVVVCIEEMPAASQADDDEEADFLPHRHRGR